MPILIFILYFYLLQLSSFVFNRYYEIKESINGCKLVVKLRIKMFKKTNTNLLLLFLTSYVYGTSVPEGLVPNQEPLVP